MAIQDFKKELEDWKDLLFLSDEERAKLKATGTKKGGSMDKFRDIMNTYEQFFYVDKTEIVQELGKRDPTILTDTEKKRLAEEFAAKCIKSAEQFFKSKKPTKGIVGYEITKLGNNRLEVIILIETDSKADTFAVLRKWRSDHVNKLAETEFADLFGRKDDERNVFSKTASKEKGTRNWNIFDIGHKHDVVRAKAAATLGKFQGDGSEEDPIKDIRDNLSQKLLKDVISNNDISLEHFQDFVDAGAGGLKFKDSFRVASSLEDAVENQDRGAKSAGIGKGIAKALSEAIATLEKEYSKPGITAKRKRSDSIEELGYKAILQNKTMRAMYKKRIARNLSSYKKAPKAKRKVTLTASEKLKRKRIALKGLATTAGIKAPKNAHQRATRDGGDNELLRKAMETRAFVQSRLTKQVQSNMGRPALENRTGRFAESVQLVNVMPKGNQFHMDYTYDDRYRGFELGRQYPAGYDPRPLIERSIRDLAAAKLETKFTLRRV
jgi:hypothetical protein